MAKRTRKRKFNIDRDEISGRIKKFYTDDLHDQDADREARLQRYAKFRGWTEGRDYIGDQTSDASLPDMMTQSNKIQDTLHNAVMSSRPIVSATAISERNKSQQDDIDDLIDYQFFVEQKGEKIIEELCESFVNDGDFTVFIPWVKETRKLAEVHVIEPIPDELEPEEYFLQTLGVLRLGLVSGSGWDYKIVNEKEVTDISFYTREEDDKVEMVMHKKVVVFDGPKPIVKDFDDVLYPPRAANLQRPGPSNPEGASHVILRDYPTIDELKSLKSQGFYDLMTDDDIKVIEASTTDESDTEAKIQKDDFQGSNDSKSNKLVSHMQLTRLMVFDCYDIDGDGLDEDVIWWYILETNTVIKVMYKSEIYPGMRRPFAESQFLPVKGRKRGISLLEMIEGTHDLIKQTFDQTIDAGTITTTPFGFYRASGSVKQEPMRLHAGELYPLSDPQRDIYFPQMPNNSQSFGFNLMTVLDQMQEKTTTVGDLQLGRVPPGQATALRSASGAQTIIGQGEARPERILRRFFMGLTEIYVQIHELNKVFLPEKKEYFVTKFKKIGESPYRQADKETIKAQYAFSFRANVLNTSKEALQTSLSQLSSFYLNPILLQMGLVSPENVYRLAKDLGSSFGHNGSEYLTQPSPEANMPKLMAEEAISMIIDGQIPMGTPEEGAQMHLQKMQDFINSDALSLLDETGQAILRTYMEQLLQKVQMENQQMAIQQAASQQNRNQGAAGQQGGQAPDTSNQQLNSNELLNETLQQEGGVGVQ
jgi:hypothetical protein